MDAHVQIRNLTVEFRGPNGGSAITAVDNVCLDVHTNEFLCIVGPSGCGKSTMLKVVAGMVRAASGSVEIAATGRRLPSAMVWQEDALVPWRSIVANVSLPLELRGVGRRERTKVALANLEKFGLGQFAQSYPHQVSGGMRQRAGIARALVADAGVLLMDEPFGSVDAQTRLLLQEEILDLWQRDQKTVLFVTHSIEEALLLGDRVVVMSARPGRIVEILDVPFSRPRERSIERTAEFQDAVAGIWALLRQEVRRAEQLA